MEQATVIGNPPDGSEVILNVGSLVLLRLYFLLCTPLLQHLKKQSEHTRTFWIP
ncbi:hypothetical protein RHGRI_008572 [Rhododendron griersonianum]|uniref:Uncharacterized protein n=1 Tax=Rhododendron griersonianum TaxID=479676 RepID=A0AAV6L1P2_9ERIC|nr:hypothetical protein RHGRI_008572 [Rhododendron griersonianum]